MCGITGFIDFKNNSREQNCYDLKKMTDSLEHRGPDSSGLWYDQDAPIYFGHRRLAIVDLSVEGHQPMTSPCDRYTICFNGEIYNFLEIKKKLERGGHKFRGYSDTEVLLASISHHGLQNTIETIKGMFAIALWDKKDKKLILIRDHIGKKPLYFGYADNKLFFCSELKALHALSAEKPRINKKSFNQFIQYGYIASPNCIYENTYKLKPGHSITFSLNESNLFCPSEDHIKHMMHPYWSINQLNTNKKDTYDLSTQEIQEQLKGILSESVRTRMISDVPVGAFLSGGIDSSLIAAIMQEQSSKPIKTYTIGFEEAKFNEAPYAKEVSQHLGTDHTSLIITSEETRSIIPYLGEIYDEPFADISQIPTYHVCKMAKENATVALSGDGGDELFCGYSRYFMAQQLFNTTQNYPLLIRKTLSSFILACPVSMLDHCYNIIFKHIGPVRSHDLTGKRLHSIANYLPSKDINELIYKIHSNEACPERLTGYSPKHDDIYSQKMSEITSEDTFDRMMKLDMSMYLPDDILVKTDRASMSNSLEVRSPLLDKDLIEWASNISIQEKLFPDRKRGKKPLYDLVTQYVPHSIIDRPKQGFSVPMSHWLRGPLNDWANDLLTKDSLDETGLYNSDEVQKIWSAFKKGKKENSNIIWTILMAQTWYRKWHH